MNIIIRSPIRFTNMAISKLVISIIIISLYLTTVSASYYSANNISVEVLLNKPGLSYDLTPLTKYEDTDGSVKVIIIETLEDEDDIVLNEDQSDIIDQEIPMDGLINNTIPDVNWPPGQYYLYRSHFNWDIAVLVQVTNYRSNFLNFTGFVLNFIVPSELSEVMVDYKTETLELDYVIEITQEDLASFKMLGYEVVENSVSSLELTNVSLIKDNIAISLVVINQSTPDSGTGTGTEPYAEMTILTMDGPLESVNNMTENDIIDILQILNLNPALWDNATYDRYTRTEPVYIPNINYDPGLLNWTEIINDELYWLQNNSVIKGFSESDFEQIHQLTDGLNGSLMPSIMYSDNTWVLINKAAFGEPTEGTPEYYVDAAWLPPFPPGHGLITPTPKPKPIQEEDNYWIILSVGLVISVLVIGLFSYTRMVRRSILDNLNRKNIFEFIKANQGVHFKKILRELNFQPGALSYHLNVLEKSEFIKSIQDGNLRRFYLFGTKSDFKIALTTIQLRILSIVKERPGISQTKISKIIGRNKMVINYHIKILNDAELISLEKEGRESKVFTTGNAEVYLST